VLHKGSLKIMAINEMNTVDTYVLALDVTLLNYCDLIGWYINHLQIFRSLHSLFSDRLNVALSVQAPMRFTRELGASEEQVTSVGESSTGEAGITGGQMRAPRQGRCRLRSVGRSSAGVGRHAGAIVCCAK